MKTQAVVVCAALLILTTLIAESNCWTSPFPDGKRNLDIGAWNSLASSDSPLKLQRAANSLCKMARRNGCGRMKGRVKKRKTDVYVKELPL